MAEPPLSEALRAFGLPEGPLPKRPIIHGAAGTLLSFALPSPRTAPRIVAVWVAPDAVWFYAPPLDFPTEGPSAVHQLHGASASLFDHFVEATREFHEAIEALDVRVSELQGESDTPSGASLWAIQREASFLRGQIGRAAIAASECAGPLDAAFPGLADALPSLLAELDRMESFASSVLQSLSDLILLQNALDSNRIAETANELARTSNRIAELGNISNIRMLGLTYLALILGLVGAVVLIPNTAATILGMPSAAWVPGLWVDVILVVLALIPILVVFSRPWVHHVLGTLRASEGRAAEGLSDIPERVPGSGAPAAAVAGRPPGGPA